MRRMLLLLALLLSLAPLAGCGKSTAKRPEGSEFRGDIRDTKSNWKEK